MQIPQHSSAKLERSHASLHFETFVLDKNLPWITLVNGYSRPGKDFRQMSKQLTAKKLNVLFFDNRGSGETTVTQAFTAQEMVEDIVALWEHLKISKSHLLGISYGGVLALFTALAYPEKIKSLILVSTTAHSDYFNRIGLLDKPNAEEVHHGLRHYFSEKFLREKEIFANAIIQQTAKSFLAPDLREKTKLQRTALGPFTLEDRLSTLKMPILAIHGAEDRVVDPKSTQFLKNHCPQTKTVLIPEAGHLLLVECPKLFYETVLEFIESLG